MKSINFGDLYKFIVSSGLALVIFACVLPWMMLREPFDLKLKASEITQLPKDAQIILDTRLDYTEDLLRAVPLVSLVSLLAGGVLILWGFKGWSVQQKALDQEQSLKNTKLAQEVGTDAADLLVNDFFAQFRKLNKRQVKRFFTFTRLHERKEDFKVPETSVDDPKRENEMHQDLRHLREAFLLTAYDPTEKKPSGRFRHPRHVIPREWALKLAAHVAEGRTGLETDEGKRWRQIRQEVYKSDIQSIKKELKTAFNAPPTARTEPR